jgi:hypothetical protein
MVSSCLRYDLVNVQSYKPDSGSKTALNAIQPEIENRVVLQIRGSSLDWWAVLDNRLGFKIGQREAIASGKKSLKQTQHTSFRAAIITGLATVVLGSFMYFKRAQLETKAFTLKAACGFTFLTALVSAIFNHLVGNKLTQLKKSFPDQGPTFETLAKFYDDVRINSTSVNNLFFSYCSSDYFTERELKDLYDQKLTAWKRIRTTTNSPQLKDLLFINSPLSKHVVDFYFRNDSTAIGNEMRSRSKDLMNLWIKFLRPGADDEQMQILQNALKLFDDLPLKTPHEPYETKSQKN